MLTPSCFFPSMPHRRWTDTGKSTFFEHSMHPAMKIPMLVLEGRIAVIVFGIYFYSFSMVTALICCSKGSADRGQRHPGYPLSKRLCGYVTLLLFIHAYNSSQIPFWPISGVILCIYLWILVYYFSLYLCIYE